MFHEEIAVAIANGFYLDQQMGTLTVNGMNFAMPWI
jgi:hypothetical protein